VKAISSDNALLVFASRAQPDGDGIECKEHLGGFLEDSRREAA
jgi:hypothetical protein